MVELRGDDWKFYHGAGRGPNRIDVGGVSAYVFGSPVVEGPLRRVLRGMDPTEVGQTVDGEFLILFDRPDDVAVVSDPYGSVPFFYAIIDGDLLLARDYLHLWRELRTRGALTVDHSAFYEYFRLQRLFGQRTYDERSSAFPPASVLQFDAATGTVSTHQYRAPSPTKREGSAADWANRLADALRAAVGRRVNPGGEYGLFLSGGLDSRAVLGAFPDDVTPTCYTLGSEDANEGAVASELAEAAGADHVFLDRDEDYYESCLERAVSVGGGMYTFDHAHFFGLADRIDADAVFHGHALDYLFQGMYLPTHRPSVAGHPLRIERLDTIEEPLRAHYTDRISYRLTDDTPADVVPAGRRQRLVDRMRSSVADVLSTGPDFEDPHDAWDYLHVSHQFRHYTHLNVLSMAGIDQRTVAFDRELLDLFWSMPASMRVGGRAFTRAIERLSPALADVRNANTNFPVTHSGARRTAVAGWHALTRRVPGLPQTHEYPGPDDRPWPDRDALVRHRDGLRSRATALRDSPQLARLDLFDLDVVADVVSAHLDGAIDAGPGILSLLTIEEFLRQGGWPS